MSLYDQISQVYPPGARFTGKDLPDLYGKVYVITGGNAGIGKELAQLLYAKNAKIYLASRSRDKALSAISELQTTSPSSTGELIFLPLDLADLTTIKPSAQQFLQKESRLHVLFNNAGVMIPPPAKTSQGYEPQLAINNLGPFLFTKLLTPVLSETAKGETPGSVRVVWVSSSAAEAPFSPKHGVPPISDLSYEKFNARAGMAKYAISKAGNYLHATEYAKRTMGVVSVPMNPGNLSSDLWKEHGSLLKGFLRMFVLHPPLYGAYTELFAGLSPAVTLEKSGAWVGPWGRFLSIRKDLLEASMSQAEGGNGRAEEFWEWSETQVKPYL